MDIINILKSSQDANTIMKAQTDILEQLFTARIEALELQEKHLAIIHEKEELVKKMIEFEQWKKTESDMNLRKLLRVCLCILTRNLNNLLYQSIDFVPIAG